MYRGCPPSAMTSLGGSSQSGSGQSVTEYVVRVPRNPSKRYNLMAFNAADKVDFSTWNQARMERDLSAKKMYQDEEMPDSGAGSEYNRKQRDESRRRKYGIILKEFKIEDQPWTLRVNGKAGRKFKGVKKGGVTENASYFIFTQCPDGAFEAFPVSNWYNFTPLAKHRTLTAEEAEQEWDRRNKILNHFTIMQQRRLKDQGVDDEEEEGGGKQDKGGKSKKKKKNDLKIHDLEDDLELSSSESEGSGEEGEGRPKAPKKNAQRKKRKKSRSDDEAIEDSDDGDFEGQEVDYMSDGSSSDDELPGKPKPVKEEDVPKGVDEGSESSEESEEEKVEEEEEEEKKTPTPQERKKKRDSSEESDTSEESDIDGEASSALFMQKKKTPPKKDKKGGSNSSSRANSRPGTPSPDSGNTSNTLRAAASKLEQGKRGTANHTPAAKRLKMESGPQSASGKSTPQPQSGKSTPSSGDIQLTEEAVRRYLTRKPMTTKDLLKKFQTKKTGLSSEQTVNVLAQILKRLNPDRKTIHDKMHFYLKE